MDWLVAGVFGLIGLVGAAVIWIGRKDPKLKPYDPGIVRYPGAFGLGHPADEIPKVKGDKQDTKTARRSDET